MSFRLVPKSVTLNDLERRNDPYLRYFTEFMYDVVVKQYLGFKIYTVFGKKAPPFVFFYKL